MLRIHPPDTTQRKGITVQPRIYSIPSNEANPCVALDLADCPAIEVFVVGTFNDWKVGATPMMPLGEGMWGVRLELPPGRYEYKFVVDGRWLPDPAGGETVRDASGGVNSVLVVHPEPVFQVGVSA